MHKYLVSLFAALIVTATSTHAEEPENYIKYRKAMMTALGGHMAAASQIVRGKVSPEGDLAMHAQAMSELTVNLTRLFPKGSDFGETKAKAEIWENWEKFEKAAMDAKNATAKFAETVAGGDENAIAAAHKDVGKGCKACHEDFREEDEE